MKNKRLKVVNVCMDDYANYAYDNAMALRSVGIDAKCVKTMRHPFGYKDQGMVLSQDGIQQAIKEADIVQFMHSDHRFLTYAKSLKKRIFVYHTGTGYRTNPANCNKIFNDSVEAAFTDQTEFIGTGMKGEQYVATAIDIKSYQQTFGVPHNPIRIGHYPSNAEVKGTSKIIEMMSKVKARKFELLFSTTRVNHIMQRNRMQRCEIYIELFKPELKGKPYGCYGVTAFEAAAMGKVVVTNNIRPHVYARAYGDCPFVIANDEPTFIKEMERLINSHPLTILQLQKETFNWLREKHSYEATGKRLKVLLDIK